MTEMDARYHDTNRNRGKREGLKALAVVLISSVIISFIAFLSLLNIQANELMADTMVDYSMQTIDQLSIRIEESAIKIEESLSVMSTTEDIQNLLGENNHEATEGVLRVLKDYKETYQEIENVYIGTTNKEMYLYPQVELPNDYDPTSRPWYKDALNKEGFVWSEPYYDAMTGKAIISLSIPVYNNDELIGVLSADIDLNSIVRGVKEVSFGNTGYAFITDQNGHMIYHPNKEYMGRPIPIPELNEAITKGNTGFIKYVYNDSEKLSGFTKVGKLNLNIIISIDSREVTHRVKQLLYNQILIGMILLILIILVIFLIGRKLNERSLDKENSYLEDSREINYKRNELKDKLERLKEYRANGVINETEYEKKRADIIDNYVI